ncbi:MAG: hypothetical protein RJQ08_01060 [Salinisphaeraceae bacterium]
MGDTNPEIPMSLRAPDRPDTGRDGANVRSITFYRFSRHKKPKALLRVWVPSQGKYLPVLIGFRGMLHHHKNLQPHRDEILRVYGALRLVAFTYNGRTTDDGDITLQAQLPSRGELLEHNENYLHIKLHAESVFHGCIDREYDVEVQPGKIFDDLLPAGGATPTPAQHLSWADQVTGSPWFAL